ncbi:hypothetical protein VP01_3103g1 [Puccinia sorghi]|uniref:Uncharacterized protein n=1 Tax=Puccinia sorghi TaxID=27349 RepID=A0A0L6UZE4_9BASI|nr:hypothetical protein VP01_3103g1 [Puccinia sorghi]
MENISSLRKKVENVKLTLIKDQKKFEELQAQMANSTCDLTCFKDSRELEVFKQKIESSQSALSSRLDTLHQGQITPKILHMQVTHTIPITIQQTFILHLLFRLLPLSSKRECILILRGLKDMWRELKLQVHSGLIFDKIVIQLLALQLHVRILTSTNNLTLPSDSPYLITLEEVSLKFLYDENIQHAFETICQQKACQYGVERKTVSVGD